MRKLVLIMLFLLFIVPAPSVSAQSWEGRMIAPITEAAPISSGFNAERSDHPDGIHGGIDYACEGGAEVVAVADGIVVSSGPSSGYGYAVFIEHEDDTIGTFYSVYGHLDPGGLVELGPIAQGEHVGYVYDGIMGTSTGAHLHFDLQPSTATGEHKINPSIYIPNLEDPSVGPTVGGRLHKLIWDAAYDFGAPIYEVIDDFVKACVNGLKVLQESLVSLFYILITIDIALGASTLVIDSDKGNSIFKWLLYKLILYGILLFFLQNWAGTMANLLRDYFVAMGGSIMGASPVDTAKAVSDPLDLIQKGAVLVSPIIEELGKNNGAWDFATKFALIDFMWAMVFVIFGMLIVITYNIIMAYIEFYMVMLFSFVMFIFSGVKQTRYLASRSLNGVFACSIKLMFFCVFSLMLQTVMQNMTMDPIFEQKSSAAVTVTERAATGGNFGGEEGIDAFAAAISSHESGGRYDVYNSRTGIGGDNPWTGDGGYGAYQFTGESKFYDWAKNYEDNHPDGPHLHTIEEYNDDLYNSPNHFLEYPYKYSPWSYCPENQEMVAKYQMLVVFNSTAEQDWRQVAMTWCYGGPRSAEFDESHHRYWEKVCNSAAGGKPQLITLINFIILAKLVLLILMFMIMGDRLSKSIINQFSGRGFKFSAEDEG